MYSRFNLPCFQLHSSIRQSNGVFDHEFLLLFLLLLCLSCLSLVILCPLLSCALFSMGSTLIYRLGQHKNRVLLFLKIEFLGQRKNRVLLFLKIEFLGQPCNGSVDLISLREKYVSANELFCPTKGGFFLCNICPLKCEVKRYV